MKCLDANELKYPPAAGSALAQTALASLCQSEDQSLMDQFISTSDTSLEWCLYVVLLNDMNTMVVTLFL